MGCLLTVMVLLGEKGKSPFSYLRFPSLAIFALLELASMIPMRCDNAGYGSGGGGSKGWTSGRVDEATMGGWEDQNVPK